MVHEGLTEPGASDEGSDSGVTAPQPDALRQMVHELVVEIEPLGIGLTND